MRLELGAHHARQRGIDADDLLELVERDHAAASRALLQAARQRQAIEQTGRGDLRRRSDTDAGGRHAERRMQRSHEAVEPAPKRAVQLRAVGPLDPLGHVARADAAEEVDLDRNGAVALRGRERRAQQRGLAKAPRAFQATVARVQRPVHERLQLARTVDEVGPLYWLRDAQLRPTAMWLYFWLCCLLIRCPSRM